MLYLRTRFWMDLRGLLFGLVFLALPIFALSSLMIDASITFLPRLFISKTCSIKIIIKSLFVTMSISVDIVHGMLITYMKYAIFLSTFNKSTYTHGHIETSNDVTFCSGAMFQFLSQAYSFRQFFILCTHNKNNFEQL